MANNLYDRMVETARWDALKFRVDESLRSDVNEAIKSVKLIDWQKFHQAMELLEMTDKVKVTRTVGVLLKEAIKG